MISLEYLGTGVFLLAVVHTFVVKWIGDWAESYPKGSFRFGVLHLLSEVEVVFGFWAFLLFFLMTLNNGYTSSLKYLEDLHFNEAIFVFVIMIIASVEPITYFMRDLIQKISQWLHRKTKIGFIYCEFFAILSLGPISGSLITEPASITITALLLYNLLNNPSMKMIHSLLAILFVNVSIGGALTHFAAPPILMVAGKWNWDTAFVFSHFGWKSILAILINSALFILINRKEIENSNKISTSGKGGGKRIQKNTKIYSAFETTLFLILLFLVIIYSQHTHAVMAIFLFFLGLTTVMQDRVGKLHLRHSLLVSFFLGGLVYFGPLQTWWLTPLLTRLENMQLYFGAIGLTSITDNAALTYLGSQVQGLDDMNKLYLVAGSLVGGGLTLIANAPNPAGYSILQSKFKHDFNPLLLFAWALIPTFVSGTLFYFRSVLF